MFLAEVAWDWYAIREVVGEGLDRIVDNDSLWEISSKPMQILSYYIKLRDFRAVLAIESMGEITILWIKQADTFVCVAFLYGIIVY